MRDDDDDDAKEGVHTVDTIPPPAGEDDVYGAKTQVGGLTPEALAMLRQIRDERPKGVEALEELNVPIFEEDEPARPGAARVVPAAGRLATASPTPGAPAAITPAVTPKAPAAARVSAVAAVSPASPVSTRTVDARTSAAPVRPAPAQPSSTRTPEVTAPAVTASVSTDAPAAEPVVAKPAAADETPALAALFGVTKSPPAPRELPALLDPEEPDPDEPEPASYVSVFAPISGEAPAAPAAPSGRSRGLMIVLALVVVGVVVVVMGQAGWIAGFGHGAASSSGTSPP